MTRRVLLVEIGTPAELPVVTPPAPRPPSAWVPSPRPSPGLPPPTGLAVEPVADGAVLTWTPSVAGGQTIIESATDVAGGPGIWREVDRTGADSFTLALPGGARWVRVRAELNGRTSVATNALLAEPVQVGDISELEQELRDLQLVVDAVAAQAAADAAALNARADDLRDDIDATIAEVSALTGVTDDLGTEITRVETESISRDTATVETIGLLGATNGAGTAFILDGNTLRVSPTETLAQWRNSIQGEFAGQSSRIDNEEQARQDADQALANTLATVQATANNAATKAELTSAQNTFAAANQALSERLDVTEAGVRASVNVFNPGFEEGATGWAGNSSGVGELPAGVTVDSTAANAYSGTRCLRFYANDGSPRAVYNRAEFEVGPNEVVRLRMQTRTAGPPPAGAQIRVGARVFRADGSYSNHYAPWITASGATWLYENGLIDGTITAPPNATKARLFIYSEGLTENTIIVDAIEISKATLHDQVTAQLLAVTRADVQSNADEIAAHTSQIATHTAEIAGKAATTYVQAVEGTATAAASAASAAQGTADDAASQASANLTAITGMSATVGGHTASINELREVAVSAVSGNAVINPSFETDDGWDFTDSNIYFETASAYSGNRIIRIAVGSGHAINRGRAKVKTGQRIRLGGIMNPRGSVPNSGAQLELRVRRYNANGAYIAHTRIGVFDRPGNYNWHPFEASWTIPPGTAEVAFQLSTTNHTSGAFAIDDVFLEPVSKSLADVLARYSLAVSAGGDVAGMQLLAGGGISAVRFLADNFSVIDPGGGSRMEWSDGNIRVYDANRLRVQLGVW